MFNENIFNQLTPLFDTIFNSIPLTTETPKTNILESDADYQISLCVPGLKKEDLSLSIDTDGNLVIEMTKTEEMKEQEVKYLRHEFDTLQFKKVMRMPKNVKRDAISATVADGILTITLPKLTEDEKRAQQQTIEIL